MTIIINNSNNNRNNDDDDDNNNNDDSCTLIIVITRYASSLVSLIQYLIINARLPSHRAAYVRHNNDLKSSTLEFRNFHN